LGPQRILAEPSVHLFEDMATSAATMPLSACGMAVHLFEDADRWGGVADEALCGGA